MEKKSTCQYGEFSVRFLVHLYNRKSSPTFHGKTGLFFWPLPHFFARI